MRLCRATATGSLSASAYHHGGRYSRLVDLLRFLLPAVATGLIVLVVLWPQLVGGYSGFIMPVFADHEAAKDDSMRMLNPRYVGRTSNAEPYEVTASAAHMNPLDPDEIKLDDLIARVESENARTFRLSAGGGVFRRSKDALDLGGGLELVTDQGYRFTTQRATVDLEKGLVRGDSIIEGSGPAGQLVADRFEIKAEGETLRFEGRVKMIVHPGAVNEDQPS